MGDVVRRRTTVRPVRVPTAGRRAFATAAIVMVGAACTAGVVAFNSVRARNLADHEAERQLDHVVGELRADHQVNEELVTSLAGLMGTFGPPRFGPQVDGLEAGGVQEDQFARFADPRLVEHPEVQALQYAHLVGSDQRSAFESQMALRGMPSGIVEPAPEGGLRPASERNEHLVVIYNRPPVSNRAATGLDVLGRPAAASLVDHMRSSGDPAVSGSFPLVQGGGSLFAVTVQVPVYDPLAPQVTAEQREAAFRGIATAVVNFPVAVSNEVEALADDLDLTVIDAPSGVVDFEPTAVVATGDGDLVTQREPELLAELADRTEAPAAASLDLGTRRLELTATPRASMVAGYERPLRGTILVVGATITALAAALYWRWSRARRLERMAGALAEANEQLELGAARLRRIAETDLLTGLPNRTLVRHMVEQRVGEDEATTLVLVDLDRFKVLNDSIGHRHGDELLRSVAARLSSLAGEGATVGRTAGDEFAVLLPGTSEMEGRIDRLVSGLSRPFRIGERVLHLTASAGVCSYPADVWTGGEMLVKADVALHEAKRTNPGTWVPYDAEMAERAARREWLERELRAALDTMDPSIAASYQCKVDLRSGDIVGAEALARWNHPEQGPVTPAEFIPVAEETGLIVRIGELVLRDACAVLRRAFDRGVALSAMAVNVSAQQLRSDRFVQVLRSELERAEVPASAVVLEVTETVAMDDERADGELVDRLQALRDLGVSISIDDFGTGYSSMARLARLPVQELKVDRAFVSGLPNDHAQVGIVSAVLAMARHLGLNVVAEGVETADQLAWLRAEGCQEAQGWLFSRAVPADAFLDQLVPEEQRTVNLEVLRPPARP